MRLCRWTWKTSKQFNKPSKSNTVLLIIPIHVPVPAWQGSYSYRCVTYPVWHTGSWFEPSLTISTVNNLSFELLQLCSKMKLFILRHAVGLIIHKIYYFSNLYKVNFKLLYKAYLNSIQTYEIQQRKLPVCPAILQKIPVRSIQTQKSWNSTVQVSPDPGTMVHTHSYQHSLFLDD